MTDEKRAEGFHEVMLGGYADVVYVDDEGYAEGSRHIVAFSVEHPTQDPPIEWGRYLGTGEPKAARLQAACDLATALVSNVAACGEGPETDEIREILDTHVCLMDAAEFATYTAHCVEVNRGR